MADLREPPPISEGDLNNRDDDDIFASAVESHIKHPKNGQEGIIEDVEEEVNLDDEVQSHTVSSPPKLEFHTPEEDLSPAEITPSQPPKPAVRKNKNEEESEEKDQFIEISVTEPQKVGDGMGAYVTYRVTTNTNMPYFKKKSFSVTRRFSDFLGLHDKLVEKHLHLGRIVPPAPEKSVLSMTKIKMSKDENVTSDEFVEKRRAALERYLMRTSAHPVLSVDPDFREFLELEAELPKSTKTSALSGAGVIRLISRVGDTVNKITFKMDESDPWFEEKQQQIENLDLQLRRLHSSVECMVQQRKEMSMCTASFAKSAAVLGNCEEHTGLSRALSKLSEVEERIEHLQSQQANHDFYCLAELLRDYVALIGAIKDVFHQRVKVYQTWQHAQQMLTKKREQKAKLELAGKTDKIQQAREEVIEWEAKVERGQEEFENISKMIRKEVERFEQTRIHDFKSSLVKYLESLLDTQQQLIKYWETFLPEAKAIAS